MSANTDIVLAAIRAVEERDRGELFRLCHEDVEFHEAASLPYGGVTRGREQLRRGLEAHPERTWLGTWGPLQPTEAECRMDPRVVGESGDEVVVRYTQRAVSPAGERFEAPVVALYGVRDGKFARAQMFHYDTAAVAGFLERAAAPGPGPGAA